MILGLVYSVDYDVFPLDCMQWSLCDVKHCGISSVSCITQVPKRSAPSLRDAITPNLAPCKKVPSWALYPGRLSTNPSHPCYPLSPEFPSYTVDPPCHPLDPWRIRYGTYPRSRLARIDSHNSPRRSHLSDGQRLFDHVLHRPVSMM